MQQSCFVSNWQYQFPRVKLTLLSIAYRGRQGLSLGKFLFSCVIQKKVMFIALESYYEFLTGNKIGDLLFRDLQDSQSSNGSHTREYSRLSSVLEDCCELYPEEENIRAQVRECVELVRRCIKDDPDDRPDMIEAEKALRRIKSMQY